MDKPRPVSVTTNSGKIADPSTTVSSAATAVAIAVLTDIGSVPEVTVKLLNSTVFALVPPVTIAAIAVFARIESSATTRLARTRRRNYSIAA